MPPESGPMPAMSSRPSYRSRNCAARASPMAPIGFERSRNEAALLRSSSS
eukprot:CAMPEP_0182588066 /NCGR_PEP_ID=MMETSP1324-20130603/66374_1 /TAXON_ID=236786 /ORGANISM="Florenciella sp., Strain RCC1587" /LENGTH=49 /DNA_ID= /DNA_START= /DNA_END= /DNA_ORIENTATION=